jgi:hypothetical protein
MSRKHFEVIAKSINEQKTAIQDVGEDVSAKLNTLQATTNNLAHEFAGFNPNFDRRRFITACGF